MHDAGGVAVLNDGDDIKSDLVLWIVFLQQVGSGADQSLLFGFVYCIFRVAVPDGFPEFYFHRNKAAGRVSGDQVDFPFPDSKIAV